MFRFTAFVWEAADSAQSEAAGLLGARLVSSSRDWRRALRREGLQVYCAGQRPGSSTVYSLPQEQGIVVGSLFRRGSAAEAASGRRVLDVRESERILSTQGRELVRSYWGRYIAFLSDPSGRAKWVVKDPTGRMPCFMTTFRGVTVFFSCLQDALRLELLSFTINWSYVATRVAIGEGYADSTALDGVSEVRGGECIEFEGSRIDRHFYWHPRHIVSAEPIEDHAAAARELRSTTKVCAHAWAAFYGNILHRLSGGLDSSVVLGCLRDAPSRPHITCVTHFVEGGISDERPWARLAAQAAGVEHIECPRSARIDFRGLLKAAPDAIPPSGFVPLEVGPAEKPIVLARGVTALMNGDGGDSLFGRYGTRFAVADYVRRHGFRPQLLKVAEDTSLIRDTSVWKILSDSVRNSLVDVGYEGTSTEQIREGRRLVRADAFEAAATRRDRCRHPWFAKDDIPASLAQRMSLLLMDETFYDPYSQPEAADPEPVSPLLSQPVVELCLRIPGYVHIEGGRDRGLARRAFAKDVPREIIARRWKDGVQGFAEEILQNNNDFIRELLLDGILVREKLLDRAALERTLSGLPSKNAPSPGELVDHVVTEAWLRTWDACLD